MAKPEVWVAYSSADGKTIIGFILFFINLSISAFIDNSRSMINRLVDHFFTGPERSRPS
jgi:hypothetical protein